MKMMKRMLCMLLTGVLMFGCMEKLAVCTVYAKTQSTGKVSITGKQNYNNAQQMLKLINKERKKRGLSALKMDKTLTNAAILRATELGVYVPQGSPHRRPNGKLSKSADKRIIYEDCSESYGGITPKEIVDGWMGSSVHKKGILLSKAKSVGIACVTIGAPYYDYQYWVLDFSSSKAKSVQKSKKTVVFTKNVTALNQYLKKKYFSLDTYSNQLGIGEQRELFANYRGDYMYGTTRINPSSFNWSSSDTSVATVNQKGIVETKTTGTVNITAKLKTGTKASITVKLEVQELDENDYYD